MLVFSQQETGYWHIGRTQVMCRDYAKVEYYNNDLANTLKTNHLELTFEPSWHEVPKPLGHKKRVHGGHGGPVRGGGGFPGGGGPYGSTTAAPPGRGGNPPRFYGYGVSGTRNPTVPVVPGAPSHDRRERRPNDGGGRFWDPNTSEEQYLQDVERRIANSNNDGDTEWSGGVQKSRQTPQFDRSGEQLDSKATFRSFLDRCKPSAPVLQSKPAVSGVPRMAPGSSGLNSSGFGSAGLSTTSSGGGAKVGVFSAAAAMSGLGESAKAKSVTIAGSAGMTSGADTVMSEKKQLDTELTLDIDKIEAQVTQESTKPVAPKRKRKLLSGQLLDHVGNVTEQAFSMVDM